MVCPKSQPDQTTRNDLAGQTVTMRTLKRRQAKMVLWLAQLAGKNRSRVEQIHRSVSQANHHMNYLALCKLVDAESLLETLRNQPTNDPRFQKKE